MPAQSGNHNKKSNMSTAKLSKHIESQCKKHSQWKFTTNYTIYCSMLTDTNRERKGRRVRGKSVIEVVDVLMRNVLTCSRLENWVNVPRLSYPAIDRPTEEPQV